MTHAPAVARPLGVAAAVPIAAAVVLAWVVLAVVPAMQGVPALALLWLAMAMAMMVPTVTRPLQRAADGSARRAWAFVGGFVAVWLVAGVPAYLLMGAATWTPGWIALAWMAAGAYQLTPVMRRTLMDCRSVPHTGGPARYGVRQGLRCVGSCAPVMLAVMVTMMALPSTALALVLLVGVTAVLCWEKRPGTAGRLVAAVGLVMLLLAAGGFVLVGGHAATGHHSMGTSTS